MSNQSRDPLDKLILFVLILVGGALLLSPFWGKFLWPDKPPAPREEQAAKKEGDAEKPTRPGAGQKPAVAPEQPTDPEQLKHVTLGGAGAHLTVKLNPRGAGVEQIVLNHFQKAEPETGKPAWKTDPETGKPVLKDGKKVKEPLELIPADANRDIASFLFYHYADPKSEDFPVVTLGERVWKRVEPQEFEEGKPVQKAVFETEVDGVKITKTYTLEPRAYHLGFEVRLELTDPQARERLFRYQLTGPHGLPIEGQWYTSIYRNALIGQLDADAIDRNMQDLREIDLKGGGDEVLRGDKPIRYAFVANQFFASGIAVQTKEEVPTKDRPLANIPSVPDPNFLGQARPILMQSATRGVARKSDNPDEVILDTPDKKRHTFEFAASMDARERERLQAKLNAPGEVIVVHRSAINRSGKSREIITNVLDPTQTAAIFHDDITVEVSTAKDERAIKLKPGEAVVHKYLLYNGPVKVRLLRDLSVDESEGVDAALVDYYLDDLHLDTLTDYPTSWIGRLFRPLGLTRLVIWFTNVMHWILWHLYLLMHHVLPDPVVYGVCILLLTVLVRGSMHPVSRKQARSMMRMQALQPELQKLKEKHKDDKQALQMAQMELYRKHGINPLGSCWLLFLQMPVFLALYSCLQESIHFRLAPFAWIDSLTAPDMLLRLPDWIPYINKWEHYGALYYFGPYFNLLPVIAVVLMIMQQKLTMPPPADEQQELQQKWMKYSMILFGVFFYKVAAGLCLYFIASSLWGFAERKMLPKKKPGEQPAPTPPARPTLMQRMLGRLLDAQRQQAGGGNGATATTATAPPPAAAGGGGGKRKRGRQPAAGAPAQEGLLARVRAWWAEVLKQAAKK